MSDNGKFCEPGRGLVCWWFDRMLIAVIGSLIFAGKLLFFRLEVKGKEHIPRKGRVLVITNHPSYPGIFLGMYGFLWPWVLRYMAMLIVVAAKQKYLEHLGLIRRLLQHLRVIELPEKGESGADEARREAIRRQVEVLTKLQNVISWFYAECMRTPAEMHLAEFKAGVGRVVAEAARTGDFNVLFVWEQGSQVAWPKGKWPRLLFSRHWPFYRRHRVTLSISRPLPVNGLSTRLWWLCQIGPLETVGQPVADYLRSLLWAFAVKQHPDLEEFETPDLALVAKDLRQL
jgi:1-acyl-sn-glycerol-3-phosphate acyltransferase